MTEKKMADEKLGELMSPPRMWSIALAVLGATESAGTALDALRPESCLMRSMTEEPVFTLCARDELASAVVRDWALRKRAQARQRERRGDLVGARRANERVVDALQLADRMDKWREANCR